MGLPKKVGLSFSPEEQDDITLDTIDGDADAFASWF